MRFTYYPGSTPCPALGQAVWHSEVIAAAGFDVRNGHVVAGQLVEDWESHPTGSWWVTEPGERAPLAVETTEVETASGRAARVEAVHELAGDALLRAFSDATDAEVAQRAAAALLEEAEAKALWWGKVLTLAIDKGDSAADVAAVEESARRASLAEQRARRTAEAATAKVAVTHAAWCAAWERADKLGDQVMALRGQQETGS